MKVSLSARCRTRACERQKQWPGGMSGQPKSRDSWKPRVKFQKARFYIIINKSTHVVRQYLNCVLLRSSLMFGFNLKN